MQQSYTGLGLCNQFTMMKAPWRGGARKLGLVVELDVERQASWNGEEDEWVVGTVL